MDESPINLRDIQSLEAKIDAGFLEIKQDIKGITSRQDIANGRVTKLELRNSYMSGALAVLTTLFAVPAFIGTILGIVIMIRGGF